MYVTVVIVAVCSIATVRWWLLLFCLSNIEIVFKSLMMLYVLIMRRFRDFKSRRLAFLCPWFVWVLILICCLLGWFRGVCWCVSECLFSFKLVGPRNISLHLNTNSSIFPIVCGWCWSERWYGLLSTVWWFWWDRWFSGRWSFVWFRDMLFISC